MKVKILIDTKPKGMEYVRAGSTVKVDDAEGARLCYLGFAKEIKQKNKAAEQEEETEQAAEQEEETEQAAEQEKETEQAAE